MAISKWRAVALSVKEGNAARPGAARLGEAKHCKARQVERASALFVFVRGAHRTIPPSRHRPTSDGAHSGQQSSHPMQRISGTFGAFNVSASRPVSMPGALKVGASFRLTGTEKPTSCSNVARPMTYTFPSWPEHAGLCLETQPPDPPAVPRYGLAKMWITLASGAPH